MNKLSIVVAVYNEEDNVAPLVEQVHQALSHLSYEIIFVDDGSRDHTVQNILALNDPKIKLVRLRKNFGQSAAMAAGIDHAEAEYIVTIDGDLQNDPSDIPMMLEKMEKEEWGLVAGIRANRKDGMLLRKIPSKIANKIIRWSTGVHVTDYGCTLKIFESAIAKDMGLQGELHRFIPVLAHLEGASITQVDVKHHARQFGESKYGINRTFKVLADLILMLFIKKYLQKPMHLFGLWGTLLFTAGIGINVYLFILKLAFNQDIWGRPIVLLGIMLLLGGVQLITIGIVSELQIRTYYGATNKRPYTVKHVYIGNEKKT